MAETFFRYATRDDGTEVQIEIEVESWGCASTYWDPGEGVQCFVKSAWLQDDGGEQGAKVELTDAECERIEIAFSEDPPEQDYPDYDTWRDEA